MRLTASVGVWPWVRGQDYCGERFGQKDAVRSGYLRKVHHASHPTGGLEPVHLAQGITNG